MCGLVGLWLPEPASAAELEQRVAVMAAAIAHRGPDDAGVWCAPEAGLALAHRRLAILDRSAAGHQPMASASGRYWIAFNGEIYNHQALRQELQHAGLLRAPWRGHSDTETLLAAIEAWGLEAALQRAAGMWALALVDRRERRLFLARDRFGEKPLYWGWLQRPGAQPPVLAFASELAALRPAPDHAVAPPQVDAGALAAYLRLGCVPAPLCIQAGLQQLPPGALVAIEAGGGGCAPQRLPEPRPWWDAEAAAATAAAATAAHAASEAELLHDLHAVLRQVVAEQAIADVPLGSFLSGGIDSSLITALLQAASSRPVRSFTIAFPDAGGGEAGFNEAPFAAAVAAHLGTHHSEVPLSAADARALIPSLPRLYSEPFADSSQLPTHLVCREARCSGLTVALSGDGGDELFGGYNRHRLIPALQQRVGWLPAPLRHGLAIGLQALPVSRSGLARDRRRKLAEALRHAGSLADLQAALTRIWPDPDALLQPAWCATARAADRRASGSPLPAAASPAERLMLADALTYLPADILVKLDRAAMATSLETRAPFLDHRVAAAAWRLPIDLKIRGQGRRAVGKWALRRILDIYVPPQLLDRPKAGFAMPIGAWLRGPLRPWAEALLDPALLQAQGYLRPQPIQRLWRAHLAGADHTPQLWTVLMWQAWLAEWG